MRHLQRIPFAPHLVLQQVAPPYDLNSLQQAAATLGLKAGVKQVTVADLANLPLPCLAVLKPAPHPVPAASELIAPSPSTGKDEGEDKSESAPPPPYRLALVLKANEARVLLFDEKSNNPFEAPLADFEAQYSGRVILFQATSKAAVEGDQMLQAKTASQVSRKLIADGLRKRCAKPWLRACQTGRKPLRSAAEALSRKYSWSLASRRHIVTCAKRGTYACCAKRICLICPSLTTKVRLEARITVCFGRETLKVPRHRVVRPRERRL